MHRIIPIYILKEILPSFLVSLLVFTFVLLLAKILELTELVVVEGIQPLTLLRFLLYSLPFLLSLTIPMSTLLAVLLAFLRLSGDSEIVVLKSAGLSLYRLLPPVILFALWALMVTSYLTLYLVPASNRAFRNQLLALAKIRADISIKEQIFNTDFESLVLYVNRVDRRDGWMHEIFIRDARETDAANVITAGRGRLTADTKQRMLVLELYNGIVDRMEESITFDRYDLRLDLASTLSTKHLAPPDQFEMTQEELFAELKAAPRPSPRYYQYLLEIHKRFSQPFACLVLGLIAVPLGVQFRGKGRNWGVSMALGVFLVYYLLFTAGWSFGETGAYPPGLGMWVPNLIIGGAALYMLHRANRDAPLGLVAVLDYIVAQLRPARRDGAL
jgi:lipopolysaccharide export system permease protein